MEDLAKSVKQQTSYSLQLTKHVLKKEGNNSNVVFSPLSIHVVLSLLACQSEGKTLYQLLSFLRSSSMAELNSLASALIDRVFANGSHLGGPKTSYANGIWIHKMNRMCFTDDINNVYKAFFKQADFMHKAEEIRCEINSWAEKETKGLIEEILTPGSVNSSTNLIIVNALYFKGVWKRKFDSNQTREYDFHLLNGTSVPAPFMTSTKNQYLGAYKGFKVLRLPYEQGRDKRQFSMYIFLPNARGGLPALIERAGSESGFLDRHIQVSYEFVGKLRIPKFKISFGFEASKVLKELGLGEAICNNNDETKIHHKSFIGIDEEGTEAAAVSVVRRMQIAAFKPKPPMDFVADHPFLFLIREDETGVVLFIGHVLNPADVDSEDEGHMVNPIGWKRVEEYMELRSKRKVPKRTE